VQGIVYSPNMRQELPVSKSSMLYSVLQRPRAALQKNMTFVCYLAKYLRSFVTLHIL